MNKRKAVFVAVPCLCHNPSSNCFVFGTWGGNGGPADRYAYSSHKDQVEDVDMDVMSRTFDA